MLDLQLPGEDLMTRYGVEDDDIEDFFSDYDPDAEENYIHESDLIKIEMDANLSIAELESYDFGYGIAEETYKHIKENIKVEESDIDNLYENIVAEAKGDEGLGSKIFGKIVNVLKILAGQVIKLIGAAMLLILKLIGKIAISPIIFAKHYGIMIGKRQAKESFDDDDVYEADTELSESELNFKRNKVKILFKGYTKPLAETIKGFVMCASSMCENDKELVSKIFNGEGDFIGIYKLDKLFSRGELHDPHYTETRKNIIKKYMKMLANKTGKYLNDKTIGMVKSKVPTGNYINVAPLIQKSMFNIMENPKRFEEIVKPNSYKIATKPYANKILYKLKVMKADVMHSKALVSKINVNTDRSPELNRLQKGNVVLIRKILQADMSAVKETQTAYVKSVRIVSKIQNLL